MSIRILFVSALLVLAGCSDDDEAPNDAGSHDHGGSDSHDHGGTGGKGGTGGSGAKGGSGGATGTEDADAGANNEPCTATIDLLDYKLDPENIEADSGKITLCAINMGKSSHDLGVRDGSKKTLGKTMILDPGKEDRFTVELSAATYDIYCSVPGHESLGMKGKLTVK